MRKRNWNKYNRDLIKRGSITFFIDPEELNPRLLPIHSSAKELPSWKLFCPSSLVEDLKWCYSMRQESKSMEKVNGR